MGLQHHPQAAGKPPAQWGGSTTAVLGMGQGMLGCSGSSCKRCLQYRPQPYRQAGPQCGQRLIKWSNRSHRCPSLTLFTATAVAAAAAANAYLQGAHERCDITGGWRVFSADNGLQAGDELLVKHMGGRVIQASRARGWLSMVSVFWLPLVSAGCLPLVKHVGGRVI